MKNIFLILCLWTMMIGLTSVFGQNISDEARRHYDRGIAAVELAKSPADYEIAITEFKQAIALAPDWVDAYYNLGRVQEAAEKFADAIASFRQYLRLAPEASDAGEVRSLINKLEFKQEQVLSIPEIIDVLVSFSQVGWKRTDGECVTNTLAIKRVDTTIWPGTTKDFVSVGRPFAGAFSDGYHEGISWDFRPLKVEGRIFKYETQHAARVYGVCGGDPYTPGGWVMCPSLEVEIEVVSRTHVRAKQKIVNLYGINSPFMGKTYLCEYRKEGAGSIISGDESVNASDGGIKAKGKVGNLQRSRR